MNQRTIVVTGATGKQGGAVVRHLLADPTVHVRAITRSTDSPAAAALAAQGVEVVTGDLDDAPSLAAALAGAWGAFSVQTPEQAGIAAEAEQGIRFATIARDQGVQHFVYTSIGSAQRISGVPHFDSKREVEHTVRTLGFPTWTILRPTFFLENLLSPTMAQGDAISMAISPDTTLQVVAVDDIGRFAAAAFARPERFHGAEIVLASDEVTLGHLAKLISERTGREVTYNAFPPQVLRDIANGSELMEAFATMFEWLDEVGYDADIAGTAATYGIEPTSAVAWVTANYPAP